MNNITNAFRGLAALLLAALFTVNCAWAQELIHYGNESDLTSMVYDAYPGVTGAPGYDDSPNFFFDGEGVIYNADGTVTSLDSGFGGGFGPGFGGGSSGGNSFADEGISAAVVRTNVSFSESIDKSGNDESFICIDTGGMTFEQGSECTVQTLYFRYTGNDYQTYFGENYVPGNRFFAGALNVEEIKVLFSSNFCINGDLTLNSFGNNDNIKLVIDNYGFALNYKLKVPVLSDSTLTLNKPLVAYAGSSDQEGKGILKFMPVSSDVTLKVCCEAENSISAESVFISSGRVDIKGVIDANLEVESGAKFSPGNSPEKAEVNGDLNLNSGSTLFMEIAGKDENGNDILIVNGELVLGDDSGIELVLADGSALEPGESFTAVLTAENSGSLDDILSYVRTTDFTELNYDVLDSGDYAGMYAITGRRFTANEIPEPSTLALLVLGAAGLLYWRKKNA